MIPPREEAIRLLKCWGVIFALLAGNAILRYWERGIPTAVQHYAFIAMEAAVFTAVLDFADHSVRDST